MTATPALVLNCSKAALAVIRALGRRGISVVGLRYGPSQPAAASRYLRRVYQCPDPNEDEEGFIGFLHALGAQWEGSVVFPMGDESLVAVSRHKAALLRRYRVVAESWDVVRVLIEKRHTYELAARHGIPCPRMRVTRDEQEIWEFVREVGFPCLLKPSVGHAFFNRFRAKMLKVNNADELRAAMAKIADYDAEMMICEFIPGDDTCGVNYNSFCIEGRPLQEFTAQKRRLKPTLIGFQTIVVGRWLPDVAEAGRRVMATLGYSGFSCTEFKRDTRDGVYKLMEVNARHNFSGQLAVSSGQDFPYLSYLAALGVDPAGAVKGAGQSPDDIFWIDEERDAMGVVAAMRSGSDALRNYLEPYRARHVFAVWSISDPLPAARQLADTMRHVAGRRPRPVQASASLQRRLRLADTWRYRLDTTLVALGRRRNRWLSDLPNLAGNLAVDVAETVRTRKAVPHFGHAYLAALETPGPFSQDPRYRGYWYDADNHSLVGMHLGLDINKYQDKYYVIESNLQAAMMPGRRELYDSSLDPLICALTGLAEEHGFERLILLRMRWSAEQIAEFERASRETGVEIVPTNLAAMDTDGYPSVNPIVALPERLLPRTMYVICTRPSKTPLFHMVHDKVWVARWLGEALSEWGDPASRLACIPAFDRLVVPPVPDDPRWPNLVVKLAEADKARAIAMGRFTTEEEARRGLQLANGRNAIPGVLSAGLSERMLHALFHGSAKVLYQPFIPPEVVEGRARLIRLHVLISPVANAFLSAHGVIAGDDLPEALPVGLVANHRAYVVNFSAGGRYYRLTTETETQLRQVAQEYARLAGLAIQKQFVTCH